MSQLNQTYPQIDLDALEERGYQIGEQSGRKFYVPVIFNEDEWLALIAELRASRKVVERAQQLITDKGEWIMDYDDGPKLAAVLNEYEALTAPKQS